MTSDRTTRRPLAALFNRLSYPQKFILITLIFILPILAFGPLVYDQIVRIDQYGTKEYHGTLYLRPLQHLLQDVQRHEQAIAMKAVGGAAGDLNSLQSQVDTDFTALDTVEVLYGKEFETGDKVASLKKQWLDLKTTFATMDVAIAIQRHEALGNAIKQLISDIGDSSFLILDPDLDTYYTMDSVLLRLPQIQSYLTDFMIHSNNVIAAGKLADPADRKKITNDYVLLYEQLNGLNDGLNYALQQNDGGTMTERNASGQMRPLVETTLNAAVTADRVLLDTVNEVLVEGRGELTLTDLNAASRAAFDNNSELYDRASQALEKGVLARQARYSTALGLALLVALVGLIIGLTVGLNVMRSISRPLRQLILRADQLSAGDLRTRTEITSEDEVGQMGKAFNASIENLGDIVSKVMDGSAKLSSGTTEISAAANEMSAGAEAQTQQAIRTSSAMEEIAATIKEVANNAQATSQATNAAVMRAREGSGKVQNVLSRLTDANESLQRLRVRSGEIDQLVRLIADIAAQTNILSLNAAIEAAGAGAAGARFDVVAEEIRKLAQRTAESTSRIGGTVAQIQDEMQMTAKQVGELAAQAAEVDQSLEDIVEGVTSVNDMIANISTSTTQQSKAVEQVAVSLQLITQVSQQTAQAAQETAATIDDLSVLAQQLSSSVTKFTI
jgi:methyl-accepting chemotaxis protein